MSKTSAAVVAVAVALAVGLLVAVAWASVVTAGALGFSGNEQLAVSFVIFVALMSLGSGVQ